MIWELIGQTSYDPASPNRIYFSIGSAVATIALALAFGQFIRPITRFKVSVGFFRLTCVLFFTAIGFVFVAAILPFIPGKALPFLGYPVFWEILAGALMVGISIGLMYKITKPVKFNKRNGKRFLENCMSIIARGNEVDMRELAGEIYHSIEDIVRVCKKYNSSDAYFAKKEGKEYKISAHTRYGLELLNLFSDARFCELMVCYVPATAYKIFYQITNQRLYDSGGYALVQQLVRQALMNRTSILYKEEDYYGLGHFKLFTKLVFADAELIESKHRPLQAWNAWADENLETWKVKKYMEVLQLSTKAHIVSGWEKGPRSGLSCGFSQAARIARTQCLKLSKMSDDEIYDSLQFNNLQAIDWGLERIMEVVVEHEEDIRKYQFNKQTYKYMKDYSIYGEVAKGTYDFMEGLSTVRTKDEDIRFLAISLRLNIHLFKKFEENLKELYYPMLTRLWINLMGLQQATEECGEKFVKEKLFELLRTHYENAVKIDPKKAREMLPDKVRYDEEKGQLIHTYPSGNTSVLDLR